MPDLPKLPRTAPAIVRRIYEAAAARHAPVFKPRLAMSQIGGCERNLWAELQKIPSERELEGRIAVLFEHGDAVEELVVGLLKQAGYKVQEEDPKTHEQIRLEALDGRFSGYIDGQILFEQGWKLLEIKSANTKQFERLKEMGYEAWNPKYAAQVQVYMGYMGLDDALALVMCKDTSELYAEKIRFDRDAFAALEEKARGILDSEVVPARPAEAKSQYCQFCKYCDRNQWCWGPLAEVSFDA